MMGLTEAVKLTQTEYNVKKFSIGLALLQGTAWTIMSLICIVIYYTVLTISEPTKYAEYVNYLIHLVYLYYVDEAFPGQIMTGGVFNGFMFIYFFLDLAWIGLSIKMLRDNSVAIYERWGYYTLFISFWDFITFVLLGADYDKCLSAFPYDISSQAVCATAIMPVFFVAAKGFVLWIINIAVGVFALRASYRLKKEEKVRQDRLGQVRSQ